MNKLLSAGFRRLWRSRAFWLQLAAMVAVPVFLCISNAGYLEDGIKSEFYLEDLVFSMMPAVGFIFAIFISLFLSPEYSEGALRNKLIVGHGRMRIYLANLTVCVAASLIALAVYFAAAVGLGAALFGWFNRGAAEIASYFLISILAAVALTSVSVLVVMCVQNKAIATVLTIVVFVLMMISGSALIDRLNEPEQTYGYVTIKEDGTPEFRELEDNPLYIGGKLRTALEFVRDCNPEAQMIEVNNYDCDYPLRLPLLALVFSGVCSFAGAVVLKKKDIK